LGVWQFGQRPRRALKGSTNRQIPIIRDVTIPVIGMKRVRTADAPQSGRV